MSMLTPQAQGVLTEFESRSDVTREQIENLRATIYGSPVLAEQFNAAVSEGVLKHIRLLHDNAAPGGSYDGDSKTISIRSNGLQERSAENPRGSFNIGNMTFVIGHEVQHSLNYSAIERATSEFHVTARHEARSRALEHDYTPAVRALISAHRRNEASAEIAGWNAVLGRVKNGGSNPGLADIYVENEGRMADFIDGGTGKFPTYALKPNLSLNPDLTMSSTPANLEAMGKNYFDKAPLDSKLGDLSKSDYATYYGVKAIEQIIKYERQRSGHRIVLDMVALNLDEKLLEEEGIDLGRIKTPQPYYDRSQTPAALRYFDHTQDGSVDSRHNHQHVPIAPLAAASITDRRRFSDSSHPDNALYADLKQRLPSETSADRLAQITLAAKLGGVQAGQVQSVATKDDAVFVVGKTPGDRAKVDLSTPLLTEQDTMQRSETFDRQQAQTLEFRAQQANLNAQGQVGPRLTF